MDATAQLFDRIRQESAQVSAARTEHVRQVRLRWKARRRARLDAMKMALGCQDCGYREHPAALQWDHVDGDKKFELSSRWGCRWSELMAEIAKCELVCANCHAVRTASRGYTGGRPPWRHDRVTATTA